MNYRNKSVENDHGTLVNQGDVSYDYVVDQQPIGRELFHQFCKVKRPQYFRYITFLDDIARWPSGLNSALEVSQHRRSGRASRTNLAKSFAFSRFGGDEIVEFCDTATLVKDGHDLPGTSYRFEPAATPTPPKASARQTALGSGTVRPRRNRTAATVTAASLNNRHRDQHPPSRSPTAINLTWKVRKARATNPVLESRPVLTGEQQQQQQQVMTS
ncbi:conserved hypothetical protein [Culex quinquefasciatus]|uniref:Uncharacterized protein n=1 Tax=Culex quinquefasciatus TaxID=7176 RepID=B0WJ76_CULQU|nr:conserved hypothetical protein [Culex quinquefasciatus]|eukprot:XP_001848760.1 conserved hypothetical protein [Culex quinquefasciatus]